jgi:transposase
MAPSGFAPLEGERLAGRTCRTPLEARTALFEAFAVFAHRQRRHSALGYQSPDAFKEVADHNTDCHLMMFSPPIQVNFILPRRWVVERSLAWWSRNRRLAKDYARKVQSSETLIELAATRLVLRRLSRHSLHARPNPIYFTGRPCHPTRVPVVGRPLLLSHCHLCWQAIISI